MSLQVESSKLHTEAILIKEIPQTQQRKRATTRLIYVLPLVYQDLPEGQEPEWGSFACAFTFADLRRVVDFYRYPRPGPGAANQVSLTAAFCESWLSGCMELRSRSASESYASFAQLDCQTVDQNGNDSTLPVGSAEGTI